MDFVKFHSDLVEEKQEDMEDVAALPTPSPSSRTSLRRQRLSKTTSIALRGSVRRHSTFLDFRKFERSMTTLLATMLSPAELVRLLMILEERHAASSVGDSLNNPMLQVVLVSQIKEILRLEVQNTAW